VLAGGLVGVGAAAAAIGVGRHFTAVALAVALSRRAIARGRRSAVRTAGLVAVTGAALTVGTPHPAASLEAR
jgi:hypothetical protein